MRVKLAGFNMDADILRQLGPGRCPHFTPETLSAAYARISRSPLPIDQLRKKACQDVEKARKSNQKIIFEMGHHSVAEHAVFNFDIMGVSRLALEEIERFRLASYTEKSQRYVTLEGDLVLPRELRAPGDKKDLPGGRATSRTAFISRHSSGCTGGCSAGTGRSSAAPPARGSWRAGPRKTHAISCRWPPAARSASP